jgi:hypothetical protein
LAKDEASLIRETPGGGGPARIGNEIAAEAFLRWR